MSRERISGSSLLRRLNSGIIPSFLLMLVSIEILSFINGYILFSTGTSSSIWKYVGHEIFLSLILLLPVLLPAWFGKLYSIFLYLILALLTSANWIHAALYNVPIAPYVFRIFRETYFNEVQEFVQQFWSWDLVFYALVPVLLPFPFLILSLKRRPRSMKNAWIPAFLIFVVIGVKGLDTAPLRIIRWHYMGDFALACISEQKEYTILADSITKNMTLPTGILGPKESGRLIVLVIGESSGRNHYSLYGYPRPTTPNLVARKKELLVFSDIIAPHAHTIPALEKALTFANHEGDPMGCSVVDVLKNAGYYVVTLSNQPQLGPHETAASRLLGRAHQSHFFNNSNTGGYYSAASYDGVLVEALKKSISHSGNVAVIIHLMGSHSKYSMRFPKSMARFADTPPYVAQHGLNKKQIRQINDYDNSVAYTDHILEQFFLILESVSRPAVLLYFSDHGDAVYEDGHTLGHAETAGSRYMFEIPFLVWLSKEYQKERPEFFLQVQAWTSRPWQTDDLIYPILNLAGITFDGYKPEKDLFSSGYIPEKRVMGKGDYDVLFQK